MSFSLYPNSVNTSSSPFITWGFTWFTVTRILRAIEKKLDGPENYIIAGNQMQVETPEDMAKKVNGSVVA